MADSKKLAPNAVRAHITLAMRNLVDEEDLTMPDGGQSIYVKAYGRTIEITVKDVTDEL